MEKMTSILTKVKLMVFLALLMSAIALILLQLPEKPQGKVIILSSTESEDEYSVSATLMHAKGVGPHPAAVLLHGCYGVSNKHYQWAKTLNKWGYTTLIVDSFSQQGIKEICTAEDKIWQHFNQQRPKDALVALNYLQSLSEVNPNDIALFGWSYGGAITLKVLEQRAVKEEQGYSAGIAFYPSCWQYQQYLMSGKQYNANVPIRILMGEEDEWTKPIYCQQLLNNNKDELHQQLWTYTGAYHNFDDQQQRYQFLKNVRRESKEQPWGNVSVGYNKRAHLDAQIAFRAFLTDNLSEQK
jgi:dienelactone hydrolase